MMPELIDLVLLAMLAITALRIIFLKDLFAVVMLFGIYSFLSALIFVNLDAVDVAFTEASVGAGISTVLMLGTLALTGRTEKENQHSRILPLVVVMATGAALIYGTLDMPPFGHPDNPVHEHVAPRYIEESPKEVGLPNMVTSVLASYRGFDTLGETVVVFSAAIGVLSLIGIRRREENDTPESGFKAHHVLQKKKKIIIPLVILFALYVQFHGDFSPGGTIDISYKDQELETAFAKALGVPMFMAAASQQVYQMARAAGLNKKDGSPVEPSTYFRALRDSIDTDEKELEGRRDLFEDIFAKLQKAGVERSGRRLSVSPPPSTAAPRARGANRPRDRRRSCR